MQLIGWQGLLVSSRFHGLHWLVELASERTRGLGTRGTAERMVARGFIQDGAEFPSDAALRSSLRRRAGVDAFAEWAKSIGGSPHAVEHVDPD